MHIPLNLNHPFVVALQEREDIFFDYYDILCGKLAIASFASVVTSPVLQLSHTLTRFWLQSMFVAHTQCASSQFNTCLNSFSGLKVSVLERMTG